MSVSTALLNCTAAALPIALRISREVTYDALPVVLAPTEAQALADAVVAGHWLARRCYTRETVP